MCLAIPAKITTLEANSMAEVDILGVSRHVSLDLVPEAKVGDFVLVHAGFAIQVVDEEYAEETLQILKDINLVDMEAELAGTGE
ncbi:MAG: HypC/HybG/HupF family hydrogenase formation chaperone [Actinobacteria bacterium]|nr:HypC/HybG/HupF family hydrogenase formation chaperone [Actinomycetota bacterium]MCG2806986.1 HypC/HybG/HupF family hydrogenase formation chaperone [Coriobacteriia bacterium]MDO8987093.1 HypC/HybG/HupF family hydrogenase formation chaperone [Coriobacteriia bacterium]MDO9108733.1 HypC/HybG/HupF family hydrogenase formation chaperone [Coriobacteriia bacterium]